MPRFAILEHDHPFVHWDLMLEYGEALKTWRLPAAPAPGQTVPAEALGDHRLSYLDYEGPISGGRGQVRRWDSGMYEEEVPGRLAEGGPVSLRLAGKRLSGEAFLAKSFDGQWSFHFVAAS